MDVREIERAAERLQGVVHKTSLHISHTFSQMSGAELYLKCENQQKTGSFKVRGASNRLLSLKERGEMPQKVVACSAGNHAQGVAYAAQRLGIEATIVMPRSTPIAKVSATQGYGAKIDLFGDCYDDAYERALELVDSAGAMLIHPFDDPDVIAGQGSIGPEMLRSLPNVDMVLIPAGGGGLLAGVATYIKQINPRVQVIGVQAEGAPAIANSFRKGELLASKNVRTIADGIAVKQPGALTFSLIEKYVDDVVTVSDAEIASTLLLLLEREKQVVEPSGAASLAAAINGKVDVKGKRIICLLSGGNIDVSFIYKIVEQGMIKRGRLMRFNVLMLDKPGSLANVSQIVSESGGNVVRIEYDKMRADLDINEAILHIACEVSGPEAGKYLLKKIEDAGYPVVLESDGA